MTCVPREDSDQPGHPPSLIRVFRVRLRVANDLCYLHVDSEDSDHTGRMPSLILVFARRACFFVTFVLWRRNLLNLKRGSITYSFSLSSSYRPDMTEILLKRTYNRKLSIHQFCPMATHICKAFGHITNKTGER